MLCKSTPFLVYLQLLCRLCRVGRSRRLCTAEQEGWFPTLASEMEMVGVYLFLLIRTLIQESAENADS